jgi:hypothetical protein
MEQFSSSTLLLLKFLKSSRPFLRSPHNNRPLSLAQLPPLSPPRPLTALALLPLPLPHGSLRMPFHSLVHDPQVPRRAWLFCRYPLSPSFSVTSTMTSSSSLPLQRPERLQKRLEGNFYSSLSSLLVVSGYGKLMQVRVTGQSSPPPHLTSPLSVSLPLSLSLPPLSLSASPSPSPTLTLALVKQIVCNSLLPMLFIPSPMELSMVLL